MFGLGGLTKVKPDSQEDRSNRDRTLRIQDEELMQGSVKVDDGNLLCFSSSSSEESEYMCAVRDMMNIAHT